MTEPYIRKGDVIGCSLDLSVPIMNFYLNGVKVKGNFKNMNLDGMFFPVVSCSARVRYISPYLLQRTALNFSLIYTIVAVSCSAVNTVACDSHRRTVSLHCTSVCCQLRHWLLTLVSILEI